MIDKFQTKKLTLFSKIYFQRKSLRQIFEKKILRNKNVSLVFSQNNQSNTNHINADVYIIQLEIIVIFEQGIYYVKTEKGK